MSKKKKANKEAQFVLRLDREMRDRFVDICAELDTSAAREVRRFIKRFIKDYESGALDDDYGDAEHPPPDYESGALDDD